MGLAACLPVGREEGNASNGIVRHITIETGPFYCGPIKDNAITIASQFFRPDHEPAAGPSLFLISCAGQSDTGAL